MAPAPAGIKPEWYFLFLFQTLKLFPAQVLGINGELVAVLLMLAGLLVVFVLPFIDNRPAERKGRIITWPCLVAFVLHAGDDRLEPVMNTRSSADPGLIVLAVCPWRSGRPSPGAAAQEAPQARGSGIRPRSQAREVSSGRPWRPKKGWASTSSWPGYGCPSSF